MGLLSRLHHSVRTTPWLGRLALRAVPDIRWHVNLDPIGKLEIRLRRDRYCWLRSPIHHDAFMLGALKRLIRPGDVVYDIGANIGIYSRFATQQFHASKVYAFEPASGNFPRLVRNLEIGGCADRVEALKVAIGEEDGFVDFQVDDSTSLTGALDSVTHGAPSSNRRQYRLPPMKETAQGRRLDTIIKEGGLTRPDVIKIDIEGAEAMALRGAPNLLRQQTPRLAIELHNGPVGAEVLRILWEFGYHGFGYLKTAGEPVYKEIEPCDLSKIREAGERDLYLPHLAASVSAEDLLRPIQGPNWN